MAGGGLLVHGRVLEGLFGPTRNSRQPTRGLCRRAFPPRQTCWADPRQAVVRGPTLRPSLTPDGPGKIGRVMIALRGSFGAPPARLEGRLFSIWSAANLKFPHIFFNQIVPRDSCAMCWMAAKDGFVLRAAELFFRPQKLTLP